MFRAIRFNSFVAVGLAGFFHWAFMVMKHAPALSNPFATDPYDAVGSFAMIGGWLAALLALARAVFRAEAQTTSAVRSLYLIRSQSAVALAMGFTVSADVVAMVRHPDVWTTAQEPSKLVAILLVTLALAAAAQWLFLRPVLEVMRTKWTREWLWAGLGWLAGLIALFLYPERWAEGMLPHLLTILFGAFVLFASMRLGLSALVPLDETWQRPVSQTTHPSPRRRWTLVLAVGLAIGIFALVGEMSEGAGPAPLSRMVVIAAVFLGVATAGLAIAYAFVGRALGLASHP